MRRTFITTLIAAALLAASVGADDIAVQVDPRANLPAVRTFSLRVGTIESPRPELDNRLFRKKLASTIAAALAGRGLSPSATPTPDVFVDYRVVGADVAMGVPTPARGVGPQPVRVAVATLVIDLFKAGQTEPVWRGTYRDDEPTGSKLVQKLPEDARRLIERYPRVR